jgi:alpha-tubulin suppressor-like RCC1 family protein
MIHRATPLRALVAAVGVLVFYGCGGGASEEASAASSITPAGQSPTAPAPATAAPDMRPVTPMVAAGDGTSFVLTSAGTVFGWGDQTNGRLGDGEVGNASRTSPAPVIGLSGIRQIAVGDAHGLALRNDGAVFVWGANGAGQLGNGQEGGATGTPFRVPTLGQVVAVAAGREFSLALGSDGRVFAWGDNAAGQLGTGDIDNRPMPTPIPGLQDVRMIGSGGQHAFAVRRDGAVFAWGNNQDGQLGLGGSPEGDVANALTPRRIAGLDGTRVMALDGGRFHTIAALDDGSVRAFGASNVGQAGSNSEGDHFDFYPSPIVPVGIAGATAVAAGDEHTLVLTREGIALAFGHAGEGRLGDGRDGRSQSSSLPQPVDVADVVAVAAGSRHSLVIVRDGTVGCFGSNFLGQCAQSQGFSEIVNPIAVPDVAASRR